MKKMKNSLLLISTAALAVSVVGCSKLNPLKKMDDMNAEMKVMGGDVNQTNANTDAMNTNMTQGESLRTRNENIEVLEKSENMVAKMIAAGAFCQALEFQLKRGVDRSSERTEHLLETAMTEFFLRVGNYVNLYGDLDTAATSKDNNQQNIYAIAVTMSKVNANNELGASSSIKGLIEDTLRSRRSLRARGGNISEYQKVILKYERQATYLLQLRSNFLPVMALGRLTSLGDGWSVLQKIKGALAVLFGTDFTRDANDFTPELIQETTSWLNEATRVHLFLKEIGKTPKPDKDILKVYRKLKEIPAVAADHEDSASVNQAISDLNHAIRIYVDTVSADLK